MRRPPGFGWRLDGFAGNRLRGWVSIGRKAAYVRGEVEGLTVAEGLADHFRSDLQQAGKSRNGACGFDLSFSIDERNASGKLLEMFMGRSARIPFATVVLPAGTPVLLPTTSLSVAYLIKPIARPLMRAFALASTQQPAELSADVVALPKLVAESFEGVLGRHPEREAIDFYVNRLRSNPDIRSFVAELVASPEFGNSEAFPHYKTIAGLALHLQETLETMLEYKGSMLGLPPIDTKGVPIRDVGTSAEQLMSAIRAIVEDSFQSHPRPL